MVKKQACSYLEADSDTISIWVSMNFQDLYTDLAPVASH